MTLREIYFFQGPQTLPGAFDGLFGGLFLLKGGPLGARLAVYAFTALALGLLAAAPRSRRLSRLWVALYPTIFVLLCLFLIQPWDELFINLRHAQNWIETGRFSFNPGEWIEGTVETLPYLLVGALGWSGVPLLDAAFVMSLCGGLLCLYQAARLWTAWGARERLAVLMLCAVFFPPLAFNASHGFGTTVFTAVVLAMVRYLYFDSRTWRGLILLALLPLVRWEAALLSLLTFADWARGRRWSAARLSATIALVSLPTLLHQAFRLGIYGQAIPLPVQFKSSLGSPFFLVLGIRNAIADALSTHALTALLIIVGIRMAMQRKPNAVPKDARKIMASVEHLLLLIALFTLPYYFSGGDWFPSYWGRYFFPLAFFLFLYAAWLVQLAYSSLSTEMLLKCLAAPALFFVLSSLLPLSSTWKAVELVTSHRRTLAMIHEPTIARGHYRVQNLSQLGTLLNRTTKPPDRLGSSELATVMFFAHRPGVDFLGLINPDIARSPLREMPSLLRKHPYRSELPYLIFKRLRPDLLAKELPEYLYTFDFMLRDQTEGVRPYELTPALLFKALARWEKQLGGLVDPLYGGITKIESLGYSPIVVRSGDDFVGMYFVHSRVLEEHFRALHANGYEGGKISCTHLDGPCGTAAVDRTRRPRK